MDITEALRHTENALRDFIASTMRAKHGDDWEEKCAVDPRTIKTWKKTQEKEHSNQSHGVVEPRLIYYADFNDLTPIIKGNWTSEFEPAFGVDSATMQVWLDALRLVRNQEAHGRQILEHQKYAALGAAGEIRTRLMRFRSKSETAEDYFPCIERVNDDLGNVWTLGMWSPVTTGMNLRVGDFITFTITASDPSGIEPEYCVVTPRYQPKVWEPDDWKNQNVITVALSDSDIGKSREITAYIKGKSGNPHAHVFWDDMVIFVYSILPKKN